MSESLRLRACSIVYAAILFAGTGCLSVPAGVEEPARVGGHATPMADPMEEGRRAPSPIDLPREASNPGAHRVALHYHETAEHIIHREHTVEVDVDEGNTLDFDGRRYRLEQFHFHTPSEHLVDGQRFPLELHLVHFDEADAVLVVGILFDTGEESSFLERILRDTPTELGRVDRSETLRLADLVPEDSHFYVYRGSFTTPPYTEGVDWLIAKYHPEAAAEQIVRLLVLEGGNAREVQERHARDIEDF